jgi:hypothetical protein
MFKTIPPGEFFTFADENDYIAKLREWGLITASAKNAKQEFSYKRGAAAYTVAIKGFLQTGNHETAVVAFSNDALHCVHPAYLKEMQSSSFGKGSSLETGDSPQDTGLPEAGEPAKAPAQAAEDKKPAEKKQRKAPALDLPSDKVPFEAAIKEFTTKYNHFNETDEEIIVLEQVQITGENPLEVGEAWCSYSKTLKKAELTEGNRLTFEAKIVDRKLNKDVRYKINNPSKIKKQED